MAPADAGGTENVLELAGVIESDLPRESLVVRLQRGFKMDSVCAPPSGGQPFAPFGATRVENLASTAGGHACPKTVVPFPFQVARLKGSLHCSLCRVDSPQRGATDAERERILGSHWWRVKRKTNLETNLMAGSPNKKQRFHLPKRFISGEGFELGSVEG
jgi:hypothetical protein